MASSIDNRVVQMTFDNNAFERKLSDTIKSLDKLQKSLSTAGASRGLEDLGKSAKKFNLGNMSASIDGVSTKFLALSAIGVTALANITNRAVDAGIQLAKSLSFDQVRAGFQEYETNMNSIQTILANTASKGSTLEDVSGALDELNTYADQTIYNFSEMTRNIGTFTAAGVDLDTSTQAIKGIANLAAISGSNSNQASTAMYQLSQAISTGQLRLQDWNSVVNAGMGGEVFQKALFETGKAMGTIADVPIEQTFEEWTDAGNTFRGSLEENWLTSEVLTNTLQGFTGDLTEAQILSLGYTKDQAAEILKMGEIGKDAATKVKTLTQLIDTVKEAVGSGWSQSFRIIFGDFEEAKELFSEVSEAIGGFVGASADARNALLQGWKDLGGRTLLIEALQDAFYALGRILGPIKEAFRDIFPAQTAEGLFELTQRFAAFTKALAPSEKTMDNIKRAFRGFFAALEIGWTIVKELTKFFARLGEQIFGSGEGILEWAAGIGDFLTNLNEKLVEGGGIARWFENLSKLLEGPIEYIKNLKDNILDLFDSVDNVSVDGVTDRFSGLTGILDVLDNVWSGIATWFSELGANMADAVNVGDFDPVYDALNVGLLAGITALLAKFVNGGLKLDFGDGILENISDGLEELTGVMKAMQADLKSKALLKIAAAIGILTASVLVLSTIDSVALTKALTAMSVGFGQLVGAFALLNKIAAGPRSGANMLLISTGLILLGGAILILAFAVKILSSLSWEEMLKGLAGVTALLVVLTAAAIPLSNNTSGLVRAGIGLIGIAIAIGILALSMKIFATMSWEEMAKGLTGVGVGLGLIAGAINLMPKGMVAKAAGLLVIGVALNLLAISMKIFATLSWEEMAKGMAGIAGGLGIIAAAMHLMPKNMVFQAASILIISVALNALGLAVKQMSTMSWEEIGRGLAVMAGALLILALASMAMQTSIGGAIAIGVIAFSLMSMAEAVERFSELSISQLAMGLLGLAATLTVLGVAALILQPIVPALLGLGAAMLLIGGGFALFGVGAAAAAKAMEILAKTGGAAIDILLVLIDALIARLPEMAAQLAEGVLAMIKVFVDAAPVFVEAMVELISGLLDAIIELTPEFAATASVMITEFLNLIVEKSPEFVAAGFALLTDFLTGLRDNMEEVSTLALEIIVEFLEALADNMGDIVDAGAEVIVEFLRGIADNIGDVLAAGTDIIVELIKGIGESAEDIVDAGAEAVVSFLQGVADNVLMVIDAGFQIIIDFLNGLADSIRENRGELEEAGINVMSAIIEGVTDKFEDLASWLSGLPGRVVEAIGDFFEPLKTKGQSIIGGIRSGIVSKLADFRNWLSNLPGWIVDYIGSLYTTLRTSGRNLVIGLWNGVVSKLGWIKDKLIDWGRSLAHWISFGLIEKSPSRLTMKSGVNIVLGVAEGIDKTTPKALRSIDNMTGSMMNALDNAMSKIPDSLEGMDDFNPTITPVLDLTQVEQGARNINGLLPKSRIQPVASISQSQLIAASRQETDDADPGVLSSNEVRFEQNIYSPTELTTADIYRNTRNQITLAKEELSIP